MPSLLLIEDEAALQRLLSWLLLDAGYEVSVAASAEDGIDRLSSYQPDAIIFNTTIDDDAKRAAMVVMRDRAPAARILDVSEEKNLLQRGIVGISADGSIADATLDLPFPKERLLDAIAKLLAPQGAP